LVNSARSSPESPSFTPSSISAWRTQFRSVPGEIPICLAVGFSPLVHSVEANRPLFGSAQAER
jgi:hypothetical protein